MRVGVEVSSEATLRSNLGRNRAGEVVPRIVPALRKAGHRMEDAFQHWKTRPNLMRDRRSVAFESKARWGLGRLRSEVGFESNLRRKRAGEVILESSQACSARGVASKPRSSVVRRVRI